MGRTTRTSIISRSQPSTVSFTTKRITETVQTSKQVLQRSLLMPRRPKSPSKVFSQLKILCLARRGRHLILLYLFSYSSSGRISMLQANQRQHPTCQPARLRFYSRYRSSLKLAFDMENPIHPLPFLHFRLSSFRKESRRRMRPDLLRLKKIMLSQGCRKPILQLQSLRR